MIPSCSHTGVPGLVRLAHLNSSTTSGSASLISARILVRVSPRQSPSSAIRSSICSDGDRPPEPDFSMLASKASTLLGPASAAGDPERLVETPALVRIELVDVRLDAFAVRRVQTGNQVLSARVE